MPPAVGAQNRAHYKSPVVQDQEITIAVKDDFCNNAAVARLINLMNSLNYDDTRNHANKSLIMQIRA